MEKEPYDYEPEDEYNEYGDEYNDLLDEYRGDDYGGYREEPAPGPQKPARKPKRKLKRQDVMLFGSMAVAAVLVFSVIVMIFGNIVKPTVKPGSSGAGSGVGSGTSVDPGGSQAVTPPNHPVAADANTWNMQLVSPAHPVDAGFAQPELGGIPQNGVEYYFDTRIVEELVKMLEACNAVEGHSLRIVSGYRGYAYQQKQYNYYYNNYKNLGLSDEEAAAKAREHEMPAGTTEHHTGLAVDFVTGSVQTPSQSFAETSEFAWLKEHCAEYGFVLRYPADKTDITGMPYEPYHFRYVGVEDARIMTDNNLTLEEYVNKAPEAAAPAPDAGDPSISAGA